MDGLARVLGPGELTAIVNTGDDLDWWGLRVCPDLDTVMYTLAGLADDVRGWGLDGETFRALAAAKTYGLPAWFSVGDQDLATHLARTARLATGERLTQVTGHLCGALGVATRVLPMSDHARPTWIETMDGRILPFQDWLVGERSPPVAKVTFSGHPEPTPEVVGALQEADLVIIGPSNPFVSIEPILALDGIRALVASRRTIAVSPIVGGRAVKGPLADMLRGFGSPVGPEAIAGRYMKCIKGMVVETGDIAPTGLAALSTRTVMATREDRVRLAAEVVEWGVAL